MGFLPRMGSAELEVNNRWGPRALVQYSNSSSEWAGIAMAVTLQEVFGVSKQRVLS